MIKRLYAKILQWLLKPVLAEVLEKQRSVNAQISSLQSQINALERLTHGLQFRSTGAAYLAQGSAKDPS